MKVTDILLKCGTMALKTFVPGAGAAAEVIDMVNSFMGDDDEKLTPDATGDQIKQAVEKMPPDQQAMIMSKQIDVQLAEISAWTERSRILAENDATGSSTRPDIALILTWLVVFIDVCCVTALGFATYQGEIDVTSAWPMALALQVFPAGIVKAYFNLRTSEKEMKHSAAFGMDYKQKTNVVDLVSGLFSKK